MKGEYNLPLHVIALFLVLAASIGGMPGDTGDG